MEVFWTGTKSSAEGDPRYLAYQRGKQYTDILCIYFFRSRCGYEWKWGASAQSSNRLAYDRRAQFLSLSRWHSSLPPDEKAVCVKHWRVREWAAGFGDTLRLFDSGFIGLRYQGDKKAGESEIQVCLGLVVLQAIVVVVGHPPPAFLTLASTMVKNWMQSRWAEKLSSGKTVSHVSR